MKCHKNYIKLQHKKYWQAASTTIKGRQKNEKFNLKMKGMVTAQQTNLKYKYTGEIMNVFKQKFFFIHFNFVEKSG